MKAVDLIWNHDGSSTVSVVTEARGWRNPIPLVRVDEKTWKLTIDLPFGRQPFKFLADGKWCTSMDYPVWVVPHQPRNNFVEVFPDDEEGQRIPTVFRWTKGKPRQVQITGSFWSWNGFQHLKKQKNGYFETTILLKPGGVHEYKFRVDEAFMLNENLPTRKNGHYENHYVTVLDSFPDRSFNPTTIKERHGRLDHFVKIGRRPFGTYSDDTQMSLGTAMSLVECGRVDLDHMSQTCAKLFDEDGGMWRGYGGTAFKRMKVLVQGADPRETGTMFGQPEGSFGNGSVMRIAPVGFAYRNASTEILKRAVTYSVMPTHISADAIDAAFIHALAISKISKIDAKDLCSSEKKIGFLQDLRELSESISMKQKFEIMIHALQAADEKEKMSFDEKYQIASLLIGDGFGIHAACASSVALWAFLHNVEDPDEAVVEAVSYGGDADTWGGCTGSLCGALHGWQWIPNRWLSEFENGKYGRDFIVEIAKKFACVAAMEC